MQQRVIARRQTSVEGAQRRVAALRRANRALRDKLRRLVGTCFFPLQAHVMRLCGSLTPPLVALQQQQQATAARLSSSRGRLRTTRAGEGRDGEPDNLKLHVHGSSSASAASGVGIACSPPFCDR